MPGTYESTIADFLPPSAKKLWPRLSKPSVWKGSRNCRFLRIWKGKSSPSNVFKVITKFADYFKCPHYYLERHAQLDGEQHGPMAEKLSIP